MTAAATTRRWWPAVAVTVLAAAVAAGLGSRVVTPAGAVAAGVLATASVVLVGILRTRQPDAQASQDRDPAGHLGYPCACADPGRRRLLRRGALAATVAAGAALVVPLWSVTQRAERKLSRTAWRPGARLVDDRGTPLRATDLEAGAFTTVWPEGHRAAGDSQTILIRLEPGRTVTGPGRPDWLADGHVAYSKLCTHMGCSVGLYQARSDLLVCPCHQATFDVLRGATPVHGPAHRPLPQLPLAVDDGGFLVATDDFPETVGPAYWSRPS